jgi:hypothetical protein
MTRTAKTTQGDRVLVTGFRYGGGISLPYVHIMTVDSNDNCLSELTLGLGQANELGEYIRQEAEFAASAREEEVTA